LLLLSALLAFPLSAIAPVAAPSDEGQDRVYRALQHIDRVTPEVLVVRAAAPAVVFIETEVTQRVDTFRGWYNRTLTGAGSGVVIHSDGYIVTNYHVVKGSQSITVTFDGDPRRYPAELAAFERSEDLALLKIEAPAGAKQGFPTVRLGTSADLMRGEKVVAIGNPYGQAHTVSTGIISGLHRDVPIADQGLHFKNLIQTDASINLGNSGGPLLNVRGELIGINTVMNSMAENIGFAIPVDQVREVLRGTLFPQAQRRWLGFDLAQGLPLTVAGVIPGSPADEAGLCEGNLVLALDGAAVKTHDEFIHASLELAERGPVRVGIDAPEGPRELEIQAWDRVDGVLFSRLGLTVKETRLRRQSWIVVDRISPGGPADDLGLQRGDLIPAIHPRVSGLETPLRVRDRSTLAQLVSRLDPGVELALDVYRDDNRDRDYTQDELYKGSLKLR
jgi:serine protease Do